MKPQNHVHTEVPKLATAVPCLFLAITMIFVFPSYLMLDGTYVHEFSVVFHEEISLSTSFLIGCNKGHLNPYKIYHPDNSEGYAVSKIISSMHFAMLRLSCKHMFILSLIRTELLLSAFFVLLTLFTEEYYIAVFTAAFTPAVFLFFSGFGYIKYCYSNRAYSKGLNFISDYGSFKMNYVHPLFDLLLGNIPLIYALAMSTYIIILLYRGIACRQKSQTLKFMAFTGFLIGGVLPLISHQAFFNALVFTFFHTLIQMWRQKFKKQAKFLWGSMMMSFFILNLPRYSEKEFIRTSFQIQRLWYDDAINGMTFGGFKYWFDITGLFTIATISLSLWFMGPIEIQFYFPWLFTFVIFNFWKTQILPEQNIYGIYTNFFVIGSTYMIVMIKRMIDKIQTFEAKGIALGVVIVLFILNDFTSFISYFYQILIVTEQFNAKFYPMISEINKIIPPRATIFTVGEAFNPFIVLLGRRAYCYNSTIKKREGFDSSRCELMRQDYIETKGKTSFLDNVHYIIMDVLKNHSVFSYLDNDRWKSIYSNYEFRVYKNMFLELKNQ